MYTAEAQQACETVTEQLVNSLTLQHHNYIHVYTSLMRMMSNYRSQTCRWQFTVFIPIFYYRISSNTSRGLLLEEIRYTFYYMYMPFHSTVLTHRVLEQFRFTSQHSANLEGHR